MTGKDSVFLLDTNIILGFLKGDPKISEFFHQQPTNSIPVVSQITRMELLGFPNITAEEESCINRFLSFTKILPITDIICDQAILLRRKTRLKLPDALIAATAISSKLILVSCDSDLLSHVENLQSINPAQIYS